MTTITDPQVDAFLAAIPTDVLEQVRVTDAIRYHAHIALRDHDWTPVELAAECARDLDDAANIGALITSRLKIAATITPPSAGKTRIGKGVPFCTADCAERRGWLEDPVTGAVIGRCPCRAGVVA